MEDLRDEVVNEEVEETADVEVIDNKIEEEEKDPDYAEKRKHLETAADMVMVLAAVGTGTVVYGVTKGTKKLIGFVKGKIAALKARKAQKDSEIHEGECEEVSE